MKALSGWFASKSFDRTTDMTEMDKHSRARGECPEAEQGRTDLTKRPDRHWDAPTKRLVALAVLVLLALLIYQFRDLLIPLVIAFLLAFILDPIVDFIEERLRLPRGLATGLVFLVLVVALLGTVAAPVTAVPSIRRAILSLQLDLNRIISEIGNFFEQPVEIFEYQLDLSDVYQELSGELRRFVGTVVQGTLDVVLGIASGAFWLVFILIAAFYLVKDADRIVEHIGQLAPPGYHDDMASLRQQITEAWNSFLRGQLVLGVAMAAVTAVVGTAIGLPYAWALGLVAGVMELVPNIGPFIAAIPAVLIALLQGSSFLPLSNFWFAVLVAGLYTLLQLIENNFFVPRILGRSLNLHPLAVLVAILAGGRLGGILGVLLAAPTLATFRVVGRYILCRLYDRDPFAEPIAEIEEEKEETKKPKLSPIKQAGEEALDRLQERVKQAVERYAEHPTSAGGSEETDKPVFDRERLNSDDR